MDMHKCSDCEQEVKPNKFKGIKISIELDGYERIKGQLRNIEATYDRILEKQEKVANNSRCMDNDKVGITIDCMSDKYIDKITYAVRREMGEKMVDELRKVGAMLPHYGC